MSEEIIKKPPRRIRNKQESETIHRAEKAKARKRAKMELKKKKERQKRGRRDR